MMFGFLWDMRPYLRQVAGQLVLGSLAGIAMNTAVVLPAILLGRAIDRALAFERGQAASADVALGGARLPGRYAPHRTATHEQTVVAHDRQRPYPSQRAG